MDIRPAIPADFPAILAIGNTINTRPFTMAEFIQRESQRDPSLPFQRFVAVVDGQIVGHAAGGRAPFTTDREMQCIIQVLHEHRSRGIGTALLEALSAFYQVHQPQRLRAAVRDVDPSSRRWAERRGFHLDCHIFESVADLEGFDATPYREVVERLNQEGIQLVPYTSLNHPDAPQKLFAMASTLYRDLPDADNWPPLVFETWSDKFFRSKQAWVDSCLVAVAPGDEWIGYTYMSRILGRPGAAYLENTWVDRRWRGKSVALALKVAGMALAQQAGMKEVSTNNHSGNQPILALNRRLGFTPRPGIYVLMRDLHE